MVLVYDDYAEDDLIGHSYARDALADLISKSDSIGSSSLTLAVYGDWGTGKTTILRQTQRILDANKSFITVWFNPWQFNQDDEIMSALLYTISRRFAQLADTVQESGAQPESFEGVAEKLKVAARAIQYKPKVKLDIPLVGKAEFDLSRKSASFDEKSLNELATVFEDRIADTYFDLVRHLERACEATEKRIIVFIDDLDRCSEQQTMRLLEGLKTLLDLPKFVFVLGMANRIVEAAVKRSLNLDSATEQSIDNRSEQQNYLDKIIQFSFHLPRPDVRKVKENIVAPHLKGADNINELLDIIIQSVGVNPRSLKRFLNTLHFSKLLFLQRKGDEELDFESLVRSSLLAHSLPNLFREFQKFPIALVEVSASISAEHDADAQDASDIVYTRNGAISRLIDNEIAVKLHQILRRGNGKTVFNSVSQVEDYVALALDAIDATGPHQIQAKEGNTRVLKDERSLKRFIEDSFVRFVSGQVDVPVDKTSLTMEIEDDYELFDEPVSQALYERVIGFNPSKFVDPEKPVENITWIEAVEFCNKLSILLGVEPFYDNLESGRPKEVIFSEGGVGFRLPTEGEWLKACTYTDEDLSDHLHEIAWYIDNAAASTQRLASLRPTNEGVHDLLGNVWEWTNSSPKYDNGNDGIGSHLTTSGSQRVTKGAAWTSFGGQVSRSARGVVSPLSSESNTGFRIARTSIG
ncbi:P-loop NTPase fold protein [Pontivivens ytuae]|uniref:SUMF1/EgtB/PvdO family nonheme iron enzyme n=1 Tax=Pontivivens ytuae TaxID=2789856 RepID=A0A7S9QEI6_9RHOB|nr:P-loop NTPase fold protein [Pontivivens ytuae]QPH56015.1 SUMF1/EgtB/PvdO family nonheme iron enzyme [Pontivivens ytuae]